jgi:hypothetical protein
LRRHNCFLKSSNCLRRLSGIAFRAEDGISDIGDDGTLNAGKSCLILTEIRHKTSSFLARRSILQMIYCPESKIITRP